MTAGVTTDAIGVAVDAACQVRDAADTKAFMRAVRHFRHVLSAMPDQTLGPVSADGARRLEMLSEGVVECIEQHVTTSSEWIATLKRAQDMRARVYVPAHGFIDSPQILNEEMRNYRAAIERVFAEGKRLHDAGVPADRAAAAADFGSFTGWTRFNENAANALKRVYMELDGELK